MNINTNSRMQISYCWHLTQFPTIFNLNRLFQIGRMILLTLIYTINNLYCWFLIGRFRPLTKSSPQIVLSSKAERLYKWYYIHKINMIPKYPHLNDSCNRKNIAERWFSWSRSPLHHVELHRKTHNHYTPSKLFTLCMPNYNLLNSRV
jgi:hypothetical protein